MGGHEMAPHTPPPLSFVRRGLVFETVTVCAVTLLPPLTVSTLMASSPTMFRHAALMGPAGVALGILQALLGLLLVRYILFVRGETPADIGFRPGLRPVLESVPLVGVAYAGALLTVLALHGSVMAEAATQRARTAFMTSSAPLTFVYVIVGPLFEETIVRAYLMTRLTTLGLSTPTVAGERGAPDGVSHVSGARVGVRVPADLPHVRGVLRVAPERGGARPEPRHGRPRRLGRDLLGAGPLTLPWAPGGWYRETCPADPGPNSPASYSVTRRPSRSWA